MSPHLPFSFTLKKHPRAKRLRIAVSRAGKVTVTMPRRVSEKTALAFLAKSKPWVEQQLKRIEEQKSILPKIPTGHRYEMYKARAKRRIMERVRVINLQYRFTYHKVTIKNTSTRWGSCSTKGNLNFACQLYFLPEHLIDYVVAHELCHLKEMNHSTRFWKLVAEVVPDYKVRRAEIKKYHLL